jgi:hypothetical protein
MMSLMDVSLTLFNDALSQIDYNGFPCLRWIKYDIQTIFSSMYCSTSKFALHRQRLSHHHLWSSVLQNRLGWRWLHWCTKSSVSRTTRGTGWANSAHIRLSLPNALQVTRVDFSVKTWVLKLLNFFESYIWMNTFVVFFL